MSESKITESAAETENAASAPADNDETAKKSETTADSGEKKLLASEPPAVFSDESYACDRQYAIVLAQLMSVKEREKVYTWIERMDTMKESDDMREERDLYLKFLTVSLNNGRLVPPFTKDPLPGLRPLSTIVPRTVFNFVFKGKYTTGDPKPPVEDTTDFRFSVPDEVEPSKFFARQPVPRNGGLVYAAAFSTRK